MIAARFSRIAGLVAMVLSLGLSGCVTSNMTQADYDKMYQNQWGNYRH